jgi:hypothetical protein
MGQVGDARVDRDTKRGVVTEPPAVLDSHEKSGRDPDGT